MTRLIVPISHPVREDRNGISDRGHPRRHRPLQARQAALAGQTGYRGGTGRLWLCVGRQQGGTEKAGLAAQAPVYPAVSGRQPRKLRPFKAVSHRGTLWRQGAGTGRQCVPCVPRQRAGTGRKKVSVLWRCGKSGPGGPGTRRELVEGRNALG